MKKKIIIGVFLLLIFITATIFIVSAIDSYNCDMDPNNGVDMLEGFGAGLIIVVGGFVVFYELDLFYTTYCFFIKPKTITKSILNSLSNFSLVLIFFSGYLSDVLSGIFKEDVIVPIILFFIYVVLRIIYFMVSTRSSTQED